jgi:RHS repeat-associated protein
MTNDGSYAYTYSAENEILSGGGVTYTYDGNWMRVKKSSGTLYWRDIAGNTIEETNLSGTRLNQYVFFGGRRAVQRDSGGSYYYFQTDQIGSTRSITKVTSSGSASICYDADFTPFGSEMMHTTTCAPSYKFTGYERDSETGLDYAFNRYYNSRIGRFMSSDPLGPAASNYANPQSLNRYAYVLNNPMSFIDPRGLDCVYLGDSGKYDPGDPSSSIDTNSNLGECSTNGGLWFDGSVDPNNLIYDPDSNWVGYDDNQLNATIQVSCTRSGGSCDYSSGQSFGQGLVDNLNRVLNDEDHVIGSARLVVHGGERPCGSSLAIAGIGLATTAGEAALIGYLGPEIGGGIEGVMSWVHIGPAFAAPPIILVHGIADVVQNCF